MKRLVALCTAAAYVAAECMIPSKLAHCPATFSGEDHPSPDKSHPCETTDCKTGPNEWQVERILAAHNLYRSKHGACPMTYSKEVETYVLGSQGFITTCDTGSLTHNMGGPYGENIAMQGAAIKGHTWDTWAGVYGWYCGEEGCYDYNNGRFTQDTGHFSQVVWKGSLEVGCGICTIKKQFYNAVYMMCSYKEGGNSGAYDTNVLRPGAAAPVCAKDECADKPCGAGQTCNDPNKVDKLNDFVCTCTSDTT
eukprot:Rhum_TRINITY_DN15456_c3_g1::Rhum_TRINITY_DN15456_c3_g1_i3::g.157324::m.157324